MRAPVARTLVFEVSYNVFRLEGGQQEKKVVVALMFHC